MDETLSGSGRGPYGILSMPTEIDRMAVVINQIPNGIAAILSGDPCDPEWNACDPSGIGCDPERNRRDPK